MNVYMNTNTNTNISVFKVFGISFIILFHWLTGLLVWKIIYEKDKCWSNIPKCLIHISPMDIFGSLLGTIIVSYLTSLIICLLSILTRFVYRTIKYSFSETEIQV